MRSVSVAPDLSSAIWRVSDTVSTANFSGTNCLLSSVPAMGLLWRMDVQDTLYLSRGSTHHHAARVARMERSGMRGSLNSSRISLRSIRATVLADTRYQRAGRAASALAAARSSGGLMWRNEYNSARSYTILRQPQITSGSPVN